MGNSRMTWSPPPAVEVGQEALLTVGNQKIRLIYEGGGVWAEPEVELSMITLQPLEHKKLCRSCGAPVIWRKHHETDKRLIIDATPTADGNIALDEDGEHYHIIRFPSDHPDRRGTLYKSHWATCPDAAKWKGKKD